MTDAELLKKLQAVRIWFEAMGYENQAINMNKLLLEVAKRMEG